ncbi:MerR family transcriptional regulator [Palleronia pelagia]|uniref:MerR HTH family regulatory protein n=1 Tax=Palleronia pelagia TaxID=387096 RepID=A0A1H8IB46_9RHOB|nr:MerR family transcriptional regulator [Palleronia pelagia]SEN65664.1 MerR HTH family regulatory protein [Palleronia pelagia]
MAKSPDAFRTISEVAEWLDVPTHVLRFWESRFTQVKPVKRAGGRRYYRPADMELLGGIKQLLHEDGLTIRGVQKLLREEGVRHVAALSPPLETDPALHDSGSSNVVPLQRAGSPAQDPDAALGRWPFVDDEAPGTPEGDAQESEPAADTSAAAQGDMFAAGVNENPPAPQDDAAAGDTREADAPESETVDSADAAPDEPSDAAASDDSASDQSPAEDTAVEETAGSSAPEAPDRTPLPQPDELDEQAISVEVTAALSGLARLTVAQKRRHADALSHALDRAQSLKRAMDRADA